MKHAFSRTLAFAGRNRKELTRDPLTLIFGVLLPLVLLALMSLIQHNVPEAPFPIQSLAPGIAVFSLSFIMLFTGLLLAKDRGSSFLMRLKASPLSATQHILGYALPWLPLALVQSAICFVAAFLFGLPVTANVLLALAVLLPVAALFISMGLLLGTLCNDKQVGGFSSLLLNVAIWLSGTWFSVSLLGPVFEGICYALPFVHAVEVARAALSGDYGAIPSHLAWVLGYAVALFAVTVWAYRKKMKE